MTAIVIRPFPGSRQPGVLYRVEAILHGLPFGEPVYAYADELEQVKGEVAGRPGVTGVQVEPIVTEEVGMVA